MVLAEMRQTQAVAPEWPVEPESDMTTREHRRGNRFAPLVLSRFSEYSWRCADVFFEAAVELGEGFEANFEGDLADSFVGIEQEILRFLDSEPVNVLYEGHASGLLEYFAEVASAGIDCLGCFIERQGTAVVFIDELAGFRNSAVVFRAFFDGDFVAKRCEVLSEGAEHADEGSVLFGLEDLRLKEGFLSGFEIHFGSPR